jgi:GNAT superfamily N-acetyltransferase
MQHTRALDQDDAHVHDAQAKAYEHPDPVATVLPHLPRATTQAYVTAHAARTRSLVFATFAPAVASPATATGAPAPPEPWAAAALDPPVPNGMRRLWLWCSAPADPRAYGLLAAVLRRVAALDPARERVRMCALDARLFAQVPGHLTPYVSHWAQLAFTRDALPPARTAADSARGHAFAPLRTDAYDDVRACSVVERSHADIAAMASSSAAYRAADGRADAWCFTQPHGSVGVLFVRPEVRGRGLGRATMRCEVERGLAEGREAVLVEIAEDNAASFALCGSLGAKKIGVVCWADVLLGEFRGAE